MRFALLGFAIVLAVGLTMPTTARSDEGQLISKLDVPAKAKEAIDAMTSDVIWLTALKFPNDGNSWYRLAGFDAGQYPIQAEATAKGEPIGVYTMISFRELPDAVRRAMNSLEPKFTPNDNLSAVQAIGMNDRDVLFYELHGSAPGKKELTFQISADGKSFVKTISPNVEALLPVKPAAKPSSAAAPPAAKPIAPPPPGAFDF